jgi:hypothetical protein
VFSQWFERITDAIENERKLKKWSRAKKEAFIRGDLETLRQLSARQVGGVFEAVAHNMSTAIDPHGEERRRRVSNHEAGSGPHPSRRIASDAPQDEGQTAVDP